MTADNSYDNEEGGEKWKRESTSNSTNKNSRRKIQAERASGGNWRTEKGRRWALGVGKRTGLATEAEADSVIAIYLQAFCRGWPSCPR